MKNKNKKDHRFELRLTDHQYKQLKRLSEETGRSMSDVIVIAVNLYETIREDTDEKIVRTR